MHQITTLWIPALLAIYQLFAPPTQPLRQEPLIIREIHYHAPQAGEVMLTWGINGWQPLPEELRPEGTELLGNLMYTPMLHEAGAFSATVRTPSHVTFEYGFLTTKLTGGEIVSIWDDPTGNVEKRVLDGKQVYQVTATIQAELRDWALGWRDILDPILKGTLLAAVILVVFQIGSRRDKTAVTIILLAAILLLGLVLRLYGSYVWNASHPNSAARLIGDEPGYDNLARGLLDGYGLSWPGRVPLYPLWLAGIYLLSGGSYNAVPYLQAFLGTATIFLTFLLGKRVLNEQAGLIAASWAAVSYVLIHQTFHYLSEILFTPLLLLVALSFWQAWQHPTARNFAIAGVWVGLSNLARPTLLLFPLFVLLILLARMRNARSVRLGLTFIVSSVLVVSPWVIHNYIRYQAIFALQTSNALLWQGSPEYYHLLRDEGYTYLQIWQEVLYGPDWQEHDPNSIPGDRYWTRRALQSIAAEPLVYLRYSGEKLFTYWVGDPNADWDNTYPFNYQALRRLGFLPENAAKVMLARGLPLLALLAGFILIRRWQRLFPVYLLLAYLNLLHALTHAEIRLSEPLQPILFLLIAGAVCAVAVHSGVRLERPVQRYRHRRFAHED